MYTAMIPERKMGAFGLQTRAATLNHISWYLLITVKSGQWLSFALKVLSLTGLASLGGSGTFSALLTHLLGTLLAFYPLPMRASFWFLLLPELPSSIGLAHRCVLPWEGLLCLFLFCSASSFQSQAFSPLPVSVSPPFHSPLITLRLSFVAITTVVILGYYRSFPVTIVCKARNYVCVHHGNKPQRAWYIIGTQIFAE